MKAINQNITLLIGTMQTSIKYLDACMDIKIQSKINKKELEPLFKRDLKSTCKTTLTKLESWLNWYYKLEETEIETVNGHLTRLTDIYEQMAQIAMHLSDRGETAENAFSNDFNELLIKHNLTKHKTNIKLSLKPLFLKTDVVRWCF